MTYFNEVFAEYTDTLNAEGKCTGSGSTANGQGGAGNSASVEAPTLYDIQAVAQDGTVLARVKFWEIDGTLQILSWQESR